MPKTTKEILVSNLLALLRTRTGKEMEPRQAVTELVRLGVATGNAQRLLDAETRVRISTVEEVAKKLGTSASALLTATLSATQRPNTMQASGAAPPPLPGPRYADRHSLSDSDWALWQDLQLVLPPSEIARVREEAERMRRVAREQIDAASGAEGKP